MCIYPKSIGQHTLKTVLLLLFMTAPSFLQAGNKQASKAQEEPVRINYLEKLKKFEYAFPKMIREGVKNCIKNEDDSLFCLLESDASDTSDDEGPTPTQEEQKAKLAYAESVKNCIKKQLFVWLEKYIATKKRTKQLENTNNTLKNVIRALYSSKIVNIDLLNSIVNAQKERVLDNPMDHQNANGLQSNSSEFHTIFEKNAVRTKQEPKKILKSILKKSKSDRYAEESKTDISNENPILSKKIFGEDAIS